MIASKYLILSIKYQIFQFKLTVFTVYIVLLETIEIATMIKSIDLVKCLLLTVHPAKDWFVTQSYPTPPHVCLSGLSPPTPRLSLRSIPPQPNVCHSGLSHTTPSPTN